MSAPKIIERDGKRFKVRHIAWGWCSKCGPDLLDVTNEKVMAPVFMSPARCGQVHELKVRNLVWSLGD